MTRGRVLESAYTPHSMDPAFRVNRSPLPPERPQFYRRDAEFFYDDSDDGDDDFYDSQDMPNYDDPAFSTDPRDNPHLRSRTDLTRMRTSPIPPGYPELDGGDNERLAHLSQNPSQRTSRTRSRSPFPPQQPLTTSSDSYSSSSNDHSPFPGSSGSSYQTSTNNSRDASPTISAEKVGHAQSKPQKSTRNSPRGDLDKVDQLDESDPFGFMRHHDGPYQTVNDALTKRTPPTNPPSDQRKLKTQTQPQTHIPTSTSYTGGVLNLVPGQLMPKMPYQPEPPVDWVSPPPTIGRLPATSPYPDQHPYDPADVVPQMAPHPSEYRPPQRYQPPPQPLVFPSLASLSPDPNTVLSITNPDPDTPLPTPQPPAPNPHHHHHPPSARQSRLSLSAQPRPHKSSKQSPLQKPSSDVSRSPSMPISSSPARSTRDKLVVRASTLNMHSRSYDPRQSAHPGEQEIQLHETRGLHDGDPAPLHSQRSFDPRQDSRLAPPDIRLPSAPSVMTTSTNSSKRSGKALPRHVPKKLVMPTPLQPLQNLSQSQGLAQGNVGSTNDAYYPPPHPHTALPISSVSISTSTHTHQQLHLSKSRKSHYGGLTTREIQMARASGYYPPPMSQSKSQHRQAPGIQPSLSMHAPPVVTSDRSDRSDKPNREQEREHRRNRRQTMMNPGVGNYLEAKASTNGFKPSVGSRSTTTSNSGSGSRSGISGSRSERERRRNHHRASSDGYRAGYESSSQGGRYVDVHGYSDPNLSANGQPYAYRQPEVYAPGPQPAQPFVADPNHGYDPRTAYDPQQGPVHDIPPRDREREREHRGHRERREHRDRDKERRRSHRHTKSHPNGVSPSHPHSESPQPPSQPPRVQDIQDDKYARHILKKRATVNGQPMSWTISVNDAGLAVAPPMKEKQKSKNKSQSHLGHSGVEGIGPYFDVPGMKDRAKSSQSTKSKRSSGFNLVSLFRSSSSRDKEERRTEKERERVYQEWAASGAGTAISNSSSKDGRKLSKVRSRH